MEREVEKWLINNKSTKIEDLPIYPCLPSVFLSSCPKLQNEICLLLSKLTDNSSLSLWKRNEIKAKVNMHSKEKFNLLPGYADIFPHQHCIL